MDNALPAWLNTHSHEPNPTTPLGDGSIVLVVSGAERIVSLELLRTLAFTEIDCCHIVSTGHGASGPFRFGGVLVSDFFAAYVPADERVEHADFISADGYGTRLHVQMLDAATGPLLAWQVDGAPLRRDQGLVRLVVPGELDDALHQVKWLARIEVSSATQG